MNFKNMHIKKIIKNNSNNNNVKDSKNWVKVSGTNNYSSKNQECLLSDDEDTDHSLTERFKQWFQAPGLVRHEEYNSNNQSSYKDNFEEHEQYRPSLLFQVLSRLCGIVINTFAIIILYIATGILQLFKRVKYFSNGNTLRKMSFSFPLSFFKRFNSFCGINNYKKVKVKTKLSISRESTICDDETVFGKHSWCFWIFGICLAIICILCIYNSDPKATINQKFSICTENIKYLHNQVMNNLYNLPGHGCMLNNPYFEGCLNSFKRWVYCFISLPYRISFSGMDIDTVNETLVEKKLKNISDWKLRKAIDRMQLLKKEVENKINIIYNKNIISGQMLQKLKELNIVNQQVITKLSSDEEEHNNLHDAVSKRYEQSDETLNMLLKAKIEFEKESIEIKASVKNILQRISMDVMKIIKIEKKEIGKLDQKVNSLIKNIEKKLGSNTINNEIKILSKTLTDMQKLLSNWNAKLFNLESFQYKFFSDVTMLKKFVNDRIISEISRHLNENGELLTRVKAIVESLHLKLNQFLVQQKSNAVNIIKSKYKISVDSIHEEILNECCPKIKEFVKLSVLSILTIANNVKGCGFVNFQSLPPESCCVNKFEVSKKINKALTKLAADDIGLVDYALKSNGGEILELYSTPSLYIDMFEDSQEISEYTWLFLHRILSSPPRLVNSVNFLNDALKRPNQCWRFAGSKGSVIIKLVSIINITSISIDHILPKITLLKNTDDAAKDFDVIALSNPSDFHGSLLGSFTFKDVTNFPIQQFIIMKPMPTQYIKIFIKSNYGADVTCVYRIRIHGNVFK